MYSSLSIDIKCCIKTKLKKLEVKLIFKFFKILIVLILKINFLSNIDTKNYENLMTKCKSYDLKYFFI